MKLIKFIRDVIGVPVLVVGAAISYLGVVIMWLGHAISSDNVR